MRSNFEFHCLLHLTATLWLKSSTASLPETMTQCALSRQKQSFSIESLVSLVELQMITWDLVASKAFALFLEKVNKLSHLF